MTSRSVCWTNGGSLDQVHVPLYDRSAVWTNVYSPLELAGHWHSLVPPTHDPLTCANWQTRSVFSDPCCFLDGLSTLMVLNRLRDELHWLLMLNSTFSIAFSSIVTALSCPRWGNINWAPVRHNRLRVLCIMFGFRSNNLWKERLGRQSVSSLITLQPRLCVPRLSVSLSMSCLSMLCLYVYLCSVCLWFCLLYTSPSPRDTI